MKPNELGAKLISLSNIPSICVQGKIVSFEKAKVMGIVNVNNDSFHKDSRANSIDAAIRLAEKHVTGGASFLDLGASTSKPGSSISDSAEEWGRLLPVLKAVRARFPQIHLSVDTYHSEVARLSAMEGADLINDISAGSLDNKMFETVASLKIPYVIMHMQGTPADMQKNPHYQNVTQEVTSELSTKLQQLFQIGVSDVIVDPGFGFGKSVEHNYTLLNHLEEFKHMRVPILVGVSRKSMVTRLLNIDASEALNATTALHMLALQKGANILRVHDSREAFEAIEVYEKYVSCK
jgi:dihydropteroate synthase